MIITKTISKLIIALTLAALLLVSLLSGCASNTSNADVQTPAVRGEIPVARIGFEPQGHGV